MIIFYSIFFLTISVFNVSASHLKKNQSLTTLLSNRAYGIGDAYTRKIEVTKKATALVLKQMWVRAEAGDTSIEFKDLVNAVPEYLRPKAGDSYEHNPLMDILPAALQSMPSCTRELFAWFLYSDVVKESVCMSYEECPFWLIALIESGLDANWLIPDWWSNDRPSMFITTLDEDGRYTEALLARGMNPLLPIGDFARLPPFYFAETPVVSRLLWQAAERMPLERFLELLAIDEDALCKLPRYMHCGMDINKIDEKLLTTLLHMQVPAYQQGESAPHAIKPIDLATCLLSLGARVDIPDGDGKTVAVLAAEKAQQNPEYAWLQEAIENQAYLQEALRMRCILKDECLLMTNF